MYVLVRGILWSLESADIELLTLWLLSALYNLCVSCVVCSKLIVSIPPFISSIEVSCPSSGRHMSKLKIKVKIFNSFSFKCLLDCEASSHNLFKSLSSLLPGTNQYWCHMRNHGCDQCGVRTHDPEVVGQTP